MFIDLGNTKTPSLVAVLSASGQCLATSREADTISIFGVQEREVGVLGKNVEHEVALQIIFG